MKTTSKYLKLIPFFVASFIVVAEIAVSFNSALLPNLKDEFYVSNQLAQMTIAGGLFALGFSGIIYGGLSDAIGRRPIFLFCIVLFSITALICSYAPTIEIFLIARFLQGLGSGAGWVVGNACLKDIFHGKQYIKVMNYIHAVAGITPAVAPVLGSYLAAVTHWRVCFFSLFVFSAIAAIGIYFFQAETLQNKKTISFKSSIRDYKSLFSNKRFLVFGYVKVMAVMLIFCEVSNLPLIFVDYLNVESKLYGLYILPVFIVYTLATVISSQLGRFWSTTQILKLGLVCLIISNATLAIFNFNFPLSPIQIQLIKSLAYAGWGLIFGNATAEIVSAITGKAGMASAMMIALEMLFSALGIYFLGFFFTGTMVPLSLFMVIISLSAFIVLTLGLKKCHHEETEA